MPSTSYWNKTPGVACGSKLRSNVVKFDLATDGAASDTGSNSPVVGCVALGPNWPVADGDMIISSVGFWIPACLSPFVDRQPPMLLINAFADSSSASHAFFSAFN